MMENKTLGKQKKNPKPNKKKKHNKTNNNNKNPLKKPTTKTLHNVFWLFRSNKVENSVSSATVL